MGVQWLLRKGVSKKLVPGKERFQEKAAGSLQPAQEKVKAGTIQAPGGMETELENALKNVQ